MSWLILAESLLKIERQSRTNITNTKHQKASSWSGIISNIIPVIKFIPWQYPVSGSYALKALSTL